MISVKPVIDPISVGRVPVKVFIAKKEEYKYNMREE